MVEHSFYSAALAWNQTAVDNDTATAASSKVRYWLGSVSLDGYAAAYKVFAESDRVFSGRLGGLRMPAHFITGSDDPNSTPGMSIALAAAAPFGKAVVIDDARHMMNLTHPIQVNAAIESFLHTSCMPEG